MNSDRRPIPARKLAVSRVIAESLANVGVTANAVSVAGLFFACCAGGTLASTSLLLESNRWLYLVSAACIALRLMCNMLDGMIAVEHGNRSRVGVLYNELPDRLADAAILIGAGYAVWSLPVLGYLAAIMAILTAYIRAVGKAEGAGSEFCGPMAKPHRMAVLIIVCVMTTCWPIHWSLDSLATSDTTKFPISWMTLSLATIIIGSSLTCIRRTLRIARRLNSKA